MYFKVLPHIRKLFCHCIYIFFNAIYTPKSFISDRQKLSLAPFFVCYFPARANLFCLPKLQNLTVETQNVSRSKGQMKRNGIEVELWVPMETQLHCEMQNESTDGKNRDCKRVEQHHFDPPNAVGNVTASRGRAVMLPIMNYTNITQGPKYEDRQVGLVGQGQCSQ